MDREGKGGKGSPACEGLRCRTSTDEEKKGTKVCDYRGRQSFSVSSLPVSSH